MKMIFQKHVLQKVVFILIKFYSLYFFLIIFLEQLAEIRKVSLGTILCQNSKVITKVQPDVFSMPDNLK